MTDITRLLASLKRRSAHAKEFGHDVLFVKLEDIDAVVEALEKAQQRITELEHYAEADALPANIAEIIDSGDLETICWQLEHYKAEDYRLALYRFRTDREEAEK
ncbi:hypothetical protein ABN148_20910 [Klebsiella oxytoca]|uniref:hypothetical protein n=1 Tax=Klebsiella oxytoca TaxID=571 RepID=UPI0018A9FA86|nr:hypothetical protein [Klebsiella oxytoca]MBF8468527.1 hypothetical protein [Klebsiella oxytoca]MBZ7699779.1 hypothetical protein [Klebsiella oxytoca]